MDPQSCGQAASINKGRKSSAKENVQSAQVTCWNFILAKYPLQVWGIRV
jgi:hypothetical protein